MILINHLIRILWVLVMAAGLTACGGLTDEPITPSNTVEIESVTITTSEEMNNSWPVGIAMVRSNDVRILDRIGQLSARDWFEQMQDFQRNYSELLIDVWEVVPNQQVGPIIVDPGTDVSGYIFADYRNNKANRVRLNVDENLILRMNQDDFTVSGTEVESEWWSWFWFW